MPESNLNDIEDMEGYNPRVINLDGKVSPAVLAGLLGYNVSLLYQHSQIGRLPPDIKESTYAECVSTYIKWYKKNQDLKIEKEKHEHELRLAKLAAKKEAYGDNENEGMPPLIAAKTRQDIRLGTAKESQIWLKIAIERGDYISVREMLSLCAPFITTIKDALLTLALDFPEAQKKVDDCLETLFNLGVQLIDKAEVDKQSYVKAMLDRDIDLDDEGDFNL